MAKEKEIKRTDTTEDSFAIYLTKEKDQDDIDFTLNKDKKELEVSISWQNRDCWYEGGVHSFLLHEEDAREFADWLIERFYGDSYLKEIKK